MRLCQEWLNAGQVLKGAREGVEESIWGPEVGPGHSMFGLQGRKAQAENPSLIEGSESVGRMA